MLLGDCMGFCSGKDTAWVSFASDDPAAPTRVLQVDVTVAAPRLRLGGGGVLQVGSYHFRAQR
eukprot:COSAG05_NODE_1584_length_4486_cov_402.617506_2_plen_63_part_00